MSARHYQYCCVSPRSGEELEHIVDHERAITWRTLRENVDAQDLQRLCAQFGYDRHLHISQDWAVSFHKSRLPDGTPVYYICQSCIEYIFY